MRIFNFKHNLIDSIKRKIGPFTLEITQSHCDRQKKLYSPEEIVFKTSLNPNVSPYVEKRPKVYSKWMETALLSVDKVEKSILEPNNKSATNVTDFLLLLSFITGRRVILEKDIKRFNPNKKSSRIIGVDEFIFFVGEQVVKNFERLIEYKLETSFCNMVSLLDKEEFFERGTYAFSILNIIYDSHYSRKGIEILTKTQRNQLKKAISECIFSTGTTLELSDSLIRDLEKPTIENFGKVSAMEKIKTFLIDIDIFPNIDNAEYTKRLRYLNQIRNSLMHYGDIREFNEFDFSKNLEINVYSVELVIDIIQYYFLFEVFQIENANLQKDVKCHLKEYFEKGEYNGHKIYEESYAKYLERLENEWIES